jgi:hypothetical protein
VQICAIVRPPPVQKYPSGHAICADAPGGQKFPAVHAAAVAVPAPSAPDTAQNEPAAHGPETALSPEATQKKPGVHGVATDMPSVGQKVPIGHCVGVATRPAQNEPSGHNV